MKHILVISNQMRDPDLVYTNRLESSLMKRKNLSFRRLLFSEASRMQAEGKTEDIFKGVSFVIALGGDGTLLSVAREAAAFSVPVVGINLGHLGFLAEIDKSSAEESLEELLSGAFSTEERTMLRGELVRKNGETVVFEALNDIVISRSRCAKLIDLNVSIGNEFVDDYRADGIIISTPTGSTAYSVSAGGPIMDPGAESFLITPVSPHKLYAKTIVLPDYRAVTVTIHDKMPRSAMITADGHKDAVFELGDVLTIKKSEHKALLLRKDKNRFYSVLHRKLLGKEM